MNGKLVEVTSFSGFVDEGEEVRVIEVKANSLIISNIKE
ncbi:MAG: membrane-bound ClpP family serine protease [Bacteroidia bacterium]